MKVSRLENSSEVWSAMSGSKFNVNLAVTIEWQMLCSQNATINGGERV